jgi:UDP-glucose 4-epimerase
MPEAFVTGATGFLGRHLCQELLEWGVSVTALVRKAPKGAAQILPEGVEARVGDIANPRGRLVPSGTDFVFHLAARTSPHASADDPLGVFETNALSTARLLEEVRVREIELSRFVLASTSLVYAPSPGKRIPETAQQRPASPYAASKAAAEAHAFAYGPVYGVPVSAVRVFNAYGPGQSPSFVVPSVLAQCKEGDGVRLGNLWPIRDFVFATDVVDLMWRAARSPKARGQAFNAGTGKGTSIQDLARACMAATGARGKVSSAVSRRRKMETDFLVADPTKARVLLGWEPRTPLVEGIRLTAEAMRRPDGILS